MGTDEPRDVLGAYDVMIARGYLSQRMSVLAVSIGAASMIEATPQIPQVAALVAGSAFAASGPLIERELPNRSHLPGFLCNRRRFFGLNPICGGRRAATPAAARVPVPPRHGR